MKSPMHAILLTIVVGGSLGVTPPVVASESEMAALTCSVEPGAKASLGDGLKQLESRGRPTGDGQFTLDGPIRAGDLCIEEVSVTGAFGVLAVSALLCAGNEAEPLLRFVQQRQPELRKVDARKEGEPGLIAIYEAPRRTFAMFRGRVTLGAAGPTSTGGDSQRISYLCAYQATGPQ